jgi:hypothetical protein
VRLGDPRLTFDPDSPLTPVLPDGVFVLSDLASPAAGSWTLRLTFTPASAKTVVMATVFARSRYQVSILVTAAINSHGLPPLSLVECRHRFSSVAAGLSLDVAATRSRRAPPAAC